MGTSVEQLTRFLLPLLLSLLFSAPVAAAPTAVQQATGTCGSCVSYTITLPAAPTPGRLLTLTTRSTGGQSQVSSITGATWTRAAISKINRVAEVWYATAGSATTYTVTGSGNITAGAGTLSEWGGLDGAVPGAPQVITGTSASPQTPSLTSPTSALVIGVIAPANAPARISGPTNGWTELPIAFTTWGGFAWTLGAGAAQATSWTWASAQPYDAVAVAFSLAAAPPVISVISSSQPVSTAITWTTDIPADSQVEFGPTMAYGSLTVLDSSLVTAHRMDLPTVPTQNDQVHYRVRSRNSTGALTLGPDQAFATGPALTQQLNLSYGPSASHLYDFYSVVMGGAFGEGPVAAQRPILVFIHGGGWVTGDKQQWAPRFRALAALGFNVYSINYTLAVDGQPATRWPIQGRDVNSFLNYLQAKQATGALVGDLSSVSLWGVSAGAHLALMAGLLAPSVLGSSAPWPDRTYSIKALIADVPATDLLSLYPIGDALERQNIVTWLGYEPPSNPAGSDAASPVTYVTAFSPRTLIQAGELDTVVPVQQQQLLSDTYGTAGAAGQLTIFQGLGHALDFRDVGGVAFRNTVEFLEQYGR